MLIAERAALPKDATRPLASVRSTESSALASKVSRIIPNSIAKSCALTASSCLRGMAAMAGEQGAAIGSGESQEVVGPSKSESYHEDQKSLLDGHMGRFVPVLSDKTAPKEHHGQ